MGVKHTRQSGSRAMASFKFQLPSVDLRRVVSRLGRPESCMTVTHLKRVVQLHQRPLQKDHERVRGCRPFEYQQDLSRDAERPDARPKLVISVGSQAVRRAVLGPARVELSRAEGGLPLWLQLERDAVHQIVRYARNV